MTFTEIRQKIHHRIDQLLPEQLGLLVEFLDFLQFRRSKDDSKRSSETVQLRQPDLHPGAFIVSDDFDDPLPDSFWLGQE